MSKEENVNDHAEIDWKLWEGNDSTFSLQLPEGVCPGVPLDGTPEGDQVAIRGTTYLYIPEDRIAAFRQWALCAVADFAPFDPSEDES